MATLTGQYKPETSGKRKHWYGWGILAGGLLLAVGGTLGILTLADVKEFVNEWAAAIIFIAGAIQTLTSAVARRNVEPPVSEPVS